MSNTFISLSEARTLAGMERNAFNRIVEKLEIRTVIIRGHHFFVRPDFEEKLPAMREEFGKRTESKHRGARPGNGYAR